MQPQQNRIGGLSRTGGFVRVPPASQDMDPRIVKRIPPGLPNMDPGMVRMGNAQARNSALPTASALYTTNPTGAQTARPSLQTAQFASILGKTAATNPDAAQIMPRMVDAAARDMTTQQTLSAINRSNLNNLPAPTAQEMASYYRESALANYRHGAGGAIGAGMERRFAPAGSLAGPGQILAPRSYGEMPMVINKDMQAAEATMSALPTRTNAAGQTALTSRRQQLMDARANGQPYDEKELNRLNMEQEARSQKQRERIMKNREKRGGYSDTQIRQMRKFGRKFDGPAPPPGEYQQKNQNFDSALAMPSGRLDPAAQRRAQERIKTLTSPESRFDTSTQQGRQDYERAAVLQDMGFNEKTTPANFMSRIKESMSNPDFQRRLNSDPKTKTAFISSIHEYAKSMMDSSNDWQRWDQSGQDDEELRIVRSMIMSDPTNLQEQENILRLFSSLQAAQPNAGRQSSARAPGVAPWVQEPQPYLPMGY